MEEATDGGEGASVRAFIAVDVSAAVRNRLAEAAEALKRLRIKARWVSPGAMHLTLVFLGNVEPGKLAAAREAVDAVAAASAPFAYRALGLGAFGSARSPRILWAGIAADEGLVRTQARLDAELRARGFRLEDRPFRPHLTMGRIKQVPDPVSLRKRLAEYDGVTLGETTADRLLLLKSTLLPEGPRHEVIHAAQLAG